VLLTRGAKVQHEHTEHVAAAPDAGVVLREPRHFTSAIDRHRQLTNPAGQYALDVVLPQPQPVVVPGGKVADVQTDAGEPGDLSHRSLRKEPIGDSAHIENLDGA
jgi:hypothetical protein